MTRKRWILAGVILAVLLIGYSAGRESDSGSPTATLSPTPEPTPEPTPKPTQRAATLPTRTPVEPPEFVTPWIDWLEHQLEVLGRVTGQVDLFFDAPVGSSAESDAALALWMLFLDEQTYIADTIPSMCWFPVFEAWDAMVTVELDTWDVVTDQIIAGEVIDYAAIGATDHVTAVTDAMDAVDATCR